MDMGTLVGLLNRALITKCDILMIPWQQQVLVVSCGCWLHGSVPYCLGIDYS